MNRTNLVVVGALVVGLGGLLFFTGSMRSSGTLAMVPGTNVACLPNGHQALAIHIHPRLQITVDGVPEVVPANIGVSGTCMAELHTHDASGSIHVETATRERFAALTFADFFDVWGVPVEREGYSLTVSVNGEEVSSINDVTLEDGAVVELAYTTL